MPGMITNEKGVAKLWWKFTTTEREPMQLICTVRRQDPLRTWKIVQFAETVNGKKVDATQFWSSYPSAKTAFEHYQKLLK